MSAQGSVCRPSSGAIERRAIACAFLGLALLALAVTARWGGLAARLGDEEIPRVAATPIYRTHDPKAARPAAAVPATVTEPPSAQAVAQERVAAAPASPGDLPRPEQLPYLSAIGAVAVWTHSGPSRSVIVAVVDSGVDVTHPGLAGHIWENPRWRTDESGAVDADGCPRARYGCAFVSAETADASCGYQSPGPSGAVADDNGHGTFVAGVVVAAAGNGLGAADGAGDIGVRILPVKVLDCTGEGRASQAAAGIRYAARSGARVIVLAFSGASDSPALREAIVEARQTYGALIVAAAGNDGRAEMQFPSGYPGILAVGGTGVVRADGQVDYLRQASFSNTSGAVSVLAPAVAIMGPVPRMLCGHRDWTCIEGEPYAYASGTSYAAPLVAGASAVLIADDPGLTPDDVMRLLVGAARPIEGSLVGQVDIAAALARARSWRAGSRLD